MDLTDMDFLQKTNRKTSISQQTVNKKETIPIEIAHFFYNKIINLAEREKSFEYLFWRVLF